MSTEKRRPWWAAALIGGAAVGVTIVALWNHATPVAPALAAEVDSDRVARIESKVNEISERVARIEGKLDRR